MMSRTTRGRAKRPKKIRTCRVCGCTHDDCRQCIEKTGGPCNWIEKDLCSACAEPQVLRPAIRIESEARSAADELETHQLSKTVP